MKKVRLRGAACWVTIGAALVLSGCAGMKQLHLASDTPPTGGIVLHQTSTMAPTGSEFNHALFTDYLSLSRREFEEGDGVNSDAFALRARAAGEGKDVQPEQISARHLSSHDKPDLTSARARLVKALDSGARERAASEAAKAQTMFDCWMEEAEEESSPQSGAEKTVTPDKDLASCRSGFFAALAEIEAKPKVAAKPAPSLRRSYLIFFDWDKSNIRPDARKVLDAAAAAYKKGRFVKITLTGYTDRSGPAAYNMRLSIRRALAAKAVLVQLGIDAKDITTIGKGETDPLVPTADGVREPRNRRVQIVF